MSAELCFTPDDYINDRYEDETRWIVTLSDGRKVYQDDDRPNRTPESTWKRLADFLKNNPDLYIIGMTLGFRDHIVNVGDNADGYFFVKSAFGSTSSEKTMAMCVTGTLRNGELRTIRWLTPELIDIEEEIRDYLKAGEGLICPTNKMTNTLLNHQQPQACIVRPLSILPS